MRLAFVGVSHWHAGHYYRAAVRLPGINIVGVSDADSRAVQRVAGELDVPGYSDYRALVEEQKPDFAFVFAKHSEAAATAMALVDAGLPFVIEKPAGINTGEVAALRDHAAARGVHVGTGFNFRVSDYHKQVMEMIEEDEMTWGSFRFLSGTPQRYRQSGNSWMLDPAFSGGGSTINLSIHLFDMFRLYSRSDPTEVAALMSNHTWSLPVEDYSTVILRSPKAVATLESGYNSLGASIRFSVRTRRRQLVLRNDDTIELYDAIAGGPTLIPTKSSSNVYWYGPFVEQSLDRFAKGLGPIADLDDLVGAMKIVDAVYAADRASGTGAEHKSQV